MLKVNHLSLNRIININRTNMPSGRLIMYDWKWLRTTWSRLIPCKLIYKPISFIQLWSILQDHSASCWLVFMIMIIWDMFTTAKNMLFMTFFGRSVFALSLEITNLPNHDHRNHLRRQYSPRWFQVSDEFVLFFGLIKAAKFELSFIPTSLQTAKNFLRYRLIVKRASLFLASFFAVL